jgi:hypothetical protein
MNSQDEFFTVCAGERTQKISSVQITITGLLFTISIFRIALGGHRHGYLNNIQDRIEVYATANIIVPEKYGSRNYVIETLKCVMQLNSATA